MADTTGLVHSLNVEYVCFFSCTVPWHSNRCAHVAVPSTKRMMLLVSADEYFSRASGFSLLVLLFSSLNFVPLGFARCVPVFLSICAKLFKYFSLLLSRIYCTETTKNILKSEESCWRAQLSSL